MNKDQKLIAEAYEQIISEGPISRFAAPLAAAATMFGAQPQAKATTPAPQPAQTQQASSKQSPITVSNNGSTINLNSDVLFGFDDASVNTSSNGEQVINNLAAKIKEIAPQLTNRHEIIVTGNTDLYEITPGHNQKLSNSRAQNVGNTIKAALQGIPNLQVRAQGVGSSNPIVKDLAFPIQGNKAPEQGKAQQAPNRRVTITFNPPLPQQTQQVITQGLPKMAIQSTPRGPHIVNDRSGQKQQIAKTNTQKQRMAMQSTPAQKQYSFIKNDRSPADMAARKDYETRMSREPIGSIRY